MSLGFRSISGLDNAAAIAGILVSQIPGDGGAGPAAFIIFASASGLPPNDPTITIKILAPNNNGVFSAGSDDNGNISTTVTFVNNGNDKDFSQTGGGGGTFPDGFWNVPVRVQLNHASNQIEIDIQFSDEGVLDFNPDLTNNPGPPTPHTPNWDGVKGNVQLDITLPDTSENPDSIAIVRDSAVIANVPIDPLVNNYSYTDTVFAADTYLYQSLVYKYPDSKSAISASAPVTFGGPPSITMTMSGGITFDGAATIVFIGDPTGTYTIIKDKTNDTLYNTDADVAIPNPFIVTGFLPQ